MQQRAFPVAYPRTPTNVAASLRERTRLVHLTTIPASLGFLTGQLAYMANRGFSVTAVSSPGKDLDTFAARERVPTYAVPMARRITPLQDVVAVWRIYRVLRRVRPHIVHAQTPKGGLLGTIAAWLAGTPVRVYHIRGLPFVTAGGARRFLMRGTERIACRLAHTVLCVSHSVRDVAIAERICPARKISVLLGGSGNGVDSAGRFNPDRLRSEREQTRASFGIPQDASVVGFVGRIVRDKGVTELAAAWLALRDAHPDLHLLVVGHFEPQDPVPEHVATLFRDDPRIHLVGYVADAAPLYAAMDVVALPTYREGFPNVPLEAASMSLPVVATRVPGCVDAVLDGVTGTLVPPRNASTLAAAIASYLCDSDLRLAHGRAGRNRVLRDFRQEVLWDALFTHYESVLAQRLPGWTAQPGMLHSPQPGSV
ncbi:MAG: capsule biosynthesis protein CapM [Geminicoccaceae bacterium]|nr:capsule biosynthesis protein CapM [Geminicoccaceae bacterium]